MSRSYFNHISKIAFEGVESETDLAFRYYDADRVLLGKSMRDHLRFAVCYWHTLCWDGSDVFGDGTFGRPWQSGDDPLCMAEDKLSVAFEFFEKIGAPFFTFHDRDLAPEGDTHRETLSNLHHMLDLTEEAMERTGVSLLWGTANLFGHPRYSAGAATNPNPEVFACAALQVKEALEATRRLGGDNYVLWGGREGYETLLNTDMKRELEQLGRFMQMVVEHKHKIGFSGALLIEPKPMEPTKHQYDFDSAAVYAFLQKFGLEGEIKLNIEVNHATLAGHSFQHEISYAIANDLLGSLDINRGDPQLGWDTDQFPNQIEEVTLALYTVLEGGGLTTGGFNFDAKLRRSSMDPADLFHAHVGGIDTLARGLINAAAMIEDATLRGMLEARYQGWNGELGQKILTGRTNLEELAVHTEKTGLDPAPRSGGQERIENWVSRQLK